MRSDKASGLVVGLVEFLLGCTVLSKTKNKTHVISWNTVKQYLDANLSRFVVGAVTEPKITSLAKNLAERKNDCLMSSKHQAQLLNSVKGYFYTRH